MQDIAGPDEESSPYIKSDKESLNCFKTLKMFAHSSSFFFILSLLSANVVCVELTSDWPKIFSISNPLGMVGSSGMDQYNTV